MEWASTIKLLDMSVGTNIVLQCIEFISSYHYMQSRDLPIMLGTGELISVRLQLVARRWLM